MGQEYTLGTTTRIELAAMPAGTTTRPTTATDHKHFCLTSEVESAAERKTTSFVNWCTSGETRDIATGRSFTLSFGDTQFVTDDPALEILEAAELNNTEIWYTIYWEGVGTGKPKTEGRLSVTKFGRKSVSDAMQTAVIEVKPLTRVNGVQA
jgi:hypothetical protein